MSRFSAAARAESGNAGGVRRPAAVLWNPSSTLSLVVRTIAVTPPTVVTTAHIIDVWRTTTRGTAASTMTPDVNNDYDGNGAPPTGALLDLGIFSALPTEAAATGLVQWATMQANSALWLWSMPGGVLVPPGTGLAVGSDTVSIPVQMSDIFFVWDET